MAGIGWLTTRLTCRSDLSRPVRSHGPRQLVPQVSAVVRRHGAIGVDAYYPEFGSAVGQFSAFLATQGWPAEIEWVVPGQVARRRGRLLIRALGPNRGREHAASVYAEASMRGLGVCLEGLCCAADRTYARTVRPVSDDAAFRLLFPNGLKLAVPANKPTAVVVVGGWAWWWKTRGAAEWPEDNGDLEA